MPTSTLSQIGASVAVSLGVAYFLFFDPPYIANIIFGAVCVTWSAWTIVSILRGTDELQSAGLRYALAAASAIGVPLCLAFTMLMVAAPDIQRAVSNMTALSDLPPGAAGFGLGVTFTLVVLCTVLVIANSVWWAAKR